MKILKTAEDGNATGMLKEFNMLLKKKEVRMVRSNARDDRLHPIPICLLCEEKDWPISSFNDFISKIVNFPSRRLKNESF